MIEQKLLLGTRRAALVASAGITLAVEGRVHRVVAVLREGREREVSCMAQKEKLKHF